MRNNKIKVITGIIFLVCILIFFYTKFNMKNKQDTQVQEIKPFLGNISNTISTTGTVLPKNRLEIMPPVSGRLEELLVKEGDKVKTSQILAWMSSTERAALLDAARGESEDVLNYWKEVYKAIPLLAPIDGEVIVATTQPGQTLTTSSAVIVLSDKLIVRAQVDETDIGKIKIGQNADITLDAYPNIIIKSIVDHIYYESSTVNNVTIYKVDLVPENIPDFFRSGMNATINFIVEGKDNAILIPINAVEKSNDGNFVLLKSNNGEMPVRKKIEIGIMDDKNYEVISGLAENDIVIIFAKKYSLPTADKTSTNPFLPKMPSHKKNQGGPPPV